LLSRRHKNIGLLFYCIILNNSFITSCHAFCRNQPSSRSSSEQSFLRIPERREQQKHQRDSAPLQAEKKMPTGTEIERNNDFKKHDPNRSNRQRSKNRGQNTSGLLKWINYSLDESPIGKLPPKTLKKIIPCINIYAKLAQKRSDAAQSADKLFQRVLAEQKAGSPHAHVSTKLCNSIINVHKQTHSTQGAERAESILIWMDREYITSMTSVPGLPAATNAGVKPDVITFSSCVSAWSKSGNIDAAERATGLLILMETMHRIGHDPELEPNTIIYNAVLEAYARSSGSNINDGEGLKETCAYKAEQILKRMIRLHDTGRYTSVKPDAISYQLVIHAYSKSRLGGAPQRCEHLLKQMEDRRNAFNDVNLIPNAFSYSACINAWAKSREVGSLKAKSAFAIYTYMETRYRELSEVDAKPNVVALTSVLTACAHTRVQSSEDVKEALDISNKVWEILRSGIYGKPNHVTYCTFLTVGTRLYPSSNQQERETRLLAIANIFRDCCKDGMLCEEFLRKMQASLSPVEYEELTGLAHDDNHVVLDNRDLLKEWTRNVKEHNNHALNIKPSIHSNNLQHPNTAQQLQTELSTSHVKQINTMEKFMGSNGHYSRDLTLPAQTTR